MRTKMSVVAAVAVLACLLAAIVPQGAPVASAGDSPGIPENVAPEAERRPPADSLAQRRQMVRERLERGELREAALEAKACLAAEVSQENLELFVEVLRAKAMSRLETGDFFAAHKAAAQALSALELWKEQVVGGRLQGRAVVSRAFELEDILRKDADAIAAAAVEKARELRESSSRWWYDDRELIIEALVVLDAINTEILSREARTEVSDVWTEAYGRLGQRHIRIYKVRSNEVNR